MMMISCSINWVFFLFQDIGVDGAAGIMHGGNLSRCRSHAPEAENQG